MSETGVVVDLRGDQAIIEMESSKECESCGACLYTRAGRMVTPVTNSLNAKIGDVVRIDIEPQTVLAAAFIVYIMPIVFFFGGYTLGLGLGRVFELGKQIQAAGIIGGLCSFLGSYFIIRRLDRRARISRRFEPKMYAIIRKN